ncbi:MAG: hypothetical protein QXN05_00645 [Acidilobaceae archaeon]
MSSKRSKQTPYVDPKDLVEAFVTPEIVEKAMKELPKEVVVTPFKASQKLGVKISTAKRVLKKLKEMGLLKPVGGSRRAKLYVPVQEGK